MLKTIVLDKTGTITKGEPAVTDIVVSSNWLLLNGHSSSTTNQKPKDKNLQLPITNYSTCLPPASSCLLQLAASVERGSEHPLGAAIVRAAQAQGLSLSTPTEFQALPGQGVIAQVDGHQIVIGNLGLLQQHQINCNGLSEKAQQLQNQAKTTMWVAINGQAAGVIGIADTIKDQAQEAIRALQQQGLQVVMLTGDNQATAQAIAAEAGISEVLAEVLPGDKAAHVAQLQAQGVAVAMVGDGINDAPALAQADVGIALGAGADIAIEAAQITLIGGDLRGLVKAIALSKTTMRIIKENLFWAFAYNVILIPIAAGALAFFPGLPVYLRELHPIAAAFAMALSSITVVGNSLRLRSLKVAS
jgi:Cu+-exporting ATPase